MRLVPDVLLIGLLAGCEGPAGKPGSVGEMGTMGAMGTAGSMGSQGQPGVGVSAVWVDSQGTQTEGFISEKLLDNFVGPLKYWLDPGGSIWLVDLQTAQAGPTTSTPGNATVFASDDCTGEPLLPVDRNLLPRMVVDATQAGYAYRRLPDDFAGADVATGSRLPAGGSCDSTPGLEAAVPLTDLAAVTVPVLPYVPPFHLERP